MISSCRNRHITENGVISATNGQLVGFLLTAGGIGAGLTLHDGQDDSGEILAHVTVLAERTETVMFPMPVVFGSLYAAVSGLAASADVFFV